MTYSSEVKIPKTWSFVIGYRVILFIPASSHPLTFKRNNQSNEQEVKNFPAAARLHHPHTNPFL
jgi:hypothetical protein